MYCPKCKFTESYVVDTRPNATGIRRRRECTKCKTRFTTEERWHPAYVKTFVDLDLYNVDNDELVGDLIAAGYTIHLHKHADWQLCSKFCRIAHGRKNRRC